jgi:serine/threonine protein kinase
VEGRAQEETPGLRGQGNVQSEVLARSQRIITKNNVETIMNERKMLERFSSPFIPNMIAAFQTRESLFLMMEYMPGGDLRFHINNCRTFSETTTSRSLMIIEFLTACIMESLEYLHKQSIVHRDVKPENLVFDKLGYLRLTDFGIAKMKSSQKIEDTSGTPGYMAPEVMCKKNHSYEADFFALGVIVYECMIGRVGCLYRRGRT